MPYPVPDSIDTTSELDTYHTHKALKGLGGHRTVATIADRDAIPSERREEGMTVYVQETGLIYQLAADIETFAELPIGQKINPPKQVSEDYTLGLNDSSVYVDASGNPITITLPASVVDGKRFEVTALDLTNAIVLLPETGLI